MCSPGYAAALFRTTVSAGAEAIGHTRVRTAVAPAPTRELFGPAGNDGTRFAFSALGSQPINTTLVIRLGESLEQSSLERDSFIRNWADPRELGTAARLNPARALGSDTRGEPRRRGRALWRSGGARSPTFAYAATHDQPGASTPTTRPLTEPAATPGSGSNADPEPEADAALSAHSRALRPRVRRAAPGCALLSRSGRSLQRPSRRGHHAVRGLAHAVDVVVRWAVIERFEGVLSGLQRRIDAR